MPGPLSVKRWLLRRVKAAENLVLELPVGAVLDRGTNRIDELHREVLVVDRRQSGRKDFLRLEQVVDVRL